MNLEQALDLIADLRGDEVPVDLWDHIRLRYQNRINEGFDITFDQFAAEWADNIRAETAEDNERNREP